MSRKLPITIGITITLLVAGVQLTSAGRGDDRHQGGPDIARFADELNLTNDQLQKIEDIKADTHRKLIDGKAELEKAEMDMRDLWEKGIPTEKQVNAQIDRISTIKIGMEKIKASKRIEMLKTLTDSQLADLHKLKMKMHMRRGPMRGGKPPDMDCPMGHSMGPSF
ncbi:MAG: hypothetical protein CO189_09815 [candidate division Zixibacteria bacterium CG_4_9_14_3_um_filter_46_8]|nr:MAG: hypothetical protein CO189_09815 [candidate division Zixibacteria bacterium CG_4_9_14_3_um_filter_46_8]